MDVAQYAMYVVHELFLLGIHNFCISPGSRSTPLVLAIDAHPNVTSHIFIDERSSAFFALGLAKALQKPVAIVTTSGTAMANAYPAVIEACLSHVPLICMSADRPFQLRNSGANQTIDQIHLFPQEYLCFFADIPPFESNWNSKRIEQFLSKIKNLLYYAVVSKNMKCKKPIHLNFMFQKPFEPKYPIQKPEIEAPNILNVPIKYETKLPNILKNLFKENQNILFIFGKENNIDEAIFIPKISTLLGIIPYIDISSSVHLFVQNRIKNTKQLFETINVSGLRVIYFGETPVYEKIIEHDSIEVIYHITKYPQSDPFHRKRTHINMSCSEFFRACEVYQNQDPTWISNIKNSQNWLHHHQSASREVLHLYSQHKKNKKELQYTNTKNSLVEQICAENNKEKSIPQKKYTLLERECIEVLVKNLNDEFCIFVSNSMPVRYVNDICVDKRNIFVGSNRGASGIDGIVSSGAGFCYGLQKRGILILGDLASWHDLGGFLQLQEQDNLDLLILILNNHGGGIFEYLPVSKQSAFSTHFATRHKVLFQPVLQAMGIPTLLCTNSEEFHSSLQKLLSTNQTNIRCLEIITDAEYNMKEQREREYFLLNELKKRTPVKKNKERRNLI